MMIVVFGTEVKHYLFCVKKMNTVNVISECTVSITFHMQ